LSDYGPKFSRQPESAVVERAPGKQKDEYQTTGSNTASDGNLIEDLNEQLPSGLFTEVQ